MTCEPVFLVVPHSGTWQWLGRKTFRVNAGYMLIPGSLQPFEGTPMKPNRSGAVVCPLPQAHERACTRWLEADIVVNDLMAHLTLFKGKVGLLKFTQGC